MRNLSIIFALVFSSFTAVSCITVKDVNTRVASHNGIETERQLNDIVLNGVVFSALWQQNAAEFKALCYQAYNVATEIVREKSSLQHLRPIAIITDIDETFLDNSPYAVTRAMEGKEFDLDSWYEWTSKGEAEAFPGSLEFFNYAASRNVTVFYITNRDEVEKKGTLKNLQRLGFPFADEEHLLLRGDTSDKEARRQQVMKDYEVFLYLGDNLNDFTDLFYKKSQSERSKITDELAKDFGVKFIVLPNSGYGDWESAIPGYRTAEGVSEKDRAILKNLRGY